MTGELDRVAMISLHTSPLERPGTGDAGGLNVYVLEASRRLARRGIAVEIFTRTSSHRQDPIVEIEAGLTVRHITAGPYEGLSKQDLPGQLCAFAAGLMRTGAHAPEDHYSVVHSHYWLSGQVGWLAADRWGVPLVHTMHTMARVKNAHRPLDDPVEPAGREIGEAQVVEAADQLVANTDEEARELIELYDAPPAKVAVVPPGVDLDLFTPGSKVAARAALGIRVETALLLFVGRIQPLKAPDILIRAAAHILHERPSMADSLHVAIVGGASGSGLARPDALRELSGALGLIDRVRFVEPVERDRLALWYRAADLVVVPSYSESFGLVAVEALACGTPVVAADVGGLPTAVGDGGVLVPGHDPSIWAAVLGDLLCDPARLAQLSARGIEHAQRYSWDATADRLERVYRRALERRDPTSIDDAMVLASEPTAVLP